MSCRLNRAVRSSCNEVPVLTLMTSLEPNAASLWWSLWEGGEEREMVIETANGKHRLPSLGSWGTLFSRDGRMQFSQGEKMQSANRPWWRDAKIYRCNSVPWKIKCHRVIDRVHTDEDLTNIILEEGRRTKRHKSTARGQPAWQEISGNKNEAPILDGVNCRGNLESDGVVQRGTEQCRDADTGKTDVPMAKYHLVEDRAGAEHEAGPRK